jgi:hypothetical protein
MRILIDTSLLVEGERRNFDLGKWVSIVVPDTSPLHKLF